jgi:hypothetical protein
MLKIAVVIDHVTLNGAEYDPTFFVVSTASGAELRVTAVLTPIIPSLLAYHREAVSS